MPTKQMTDQQNNKNNQNTNTKVENCVHKLTEKTRDHLKYVKKVLQYKKREIVSPITVDRLASKVAGVYEKLRRIIDWKEEHLVRRTAIERSLKRRLITKVPGLDLFADVKAEDIAEPLILELIRSGHFSNGKISKNIIPHVEQVLAKYIYILKYNPVSKNGLTIKRNIEFYTWVLEIAACEIEEVLEPPLHENAMINFMTSSINNHLTVLPPGQLTEDEQLIQTYIAVHRTLYNLDNPIITYHLIKYKYPEWNTKPQEILQDFTKNIKNIRKQLKDALEYKKSSEFYKICENYDAVYLIMDDIIKKYEETPDKLFDIFEDEEKLEREIEEAYNQRLSTLKRRLNRSAFYSTLSMFIAGGASLFIFEIPLAQLVFGHWKPLAIVVDIMLPTVLMFILVAIIPLPKKDNVKNVIEEFKKVVYTDVPMDSYEINLKKRRQKFMNFIFGIIYFIGAIASFAGVFWLFKIANVPWTSMYIDTANIAVVVFAAMVIRQRSKELTVQDNTTFAEFAIEIFSIPLAKVGQWLANKWKEYNFVSVFFTALIDTPITTILEIFESWRNFLKDKKSGIH